MFLIEAIWIVIQIGAFIVGIITYDDYYNNRLSKSSNQITLLMMLVYLIFFGIPLGFIFAYCVRISYKKLNSIVVIDLDKKQKKPKIKF